MKLTLEQVLQKGVEAHKAGKVQEADRCYTAILKANPKHPDANHNMGVLAVGFGKVEAALPFLKTALEVGPKIAQFWLSYIDALIKLDRITDAKAVFEQAKSNGANGDAFDQLEQRLTGLEKNSIVDANSGKLKEPPIDRLQRLINLYTQGKHQEARTQASKLLKQYPSSINLYNIFGAASKGLGKLDEAIQAYKKAASIKPDYADAYYNMGIALKILGKLDEAIQTYKKAISIKPDYAEAFNNMGLAFKDQRKLDEAIQAYRNTISIKPEYAEAHYNMGNALKDQGKLDEAIQAYKKAASIKPDYADAYYNMGIALQELDRLAEAIQAYRNTISIKPEYAEAFNNMGLAFKDQRKLDEAQKAFIQATSIKPDYDAAHYNMGVALQELDRLDEAVEAYEKAISIKPNYTEAYNNIGNALQELNRLDEAVEAYKKTISINPNHAEAHNNMGTTFYEQGKIEKAIRAYSQAISIKPNYRAAWDNIYYPLQVLKSRKTTDNELSAFYPKTCGSNYAQIAISLLHYKLHRGQKSLGIYLDRALSSLSSVKNRVIQNPKFNNNSNAKINGLSDKMIALVHFGRSGTGLLHSLVDGHPEISTLPSIYFSQYFDYSSWDKIISTGWDGMVDRFISMYDVLFNAASPTPIMSISEQIKFHTGIDEGMASVGNERNEILTVDRDLFRTELCSSIKCYYEMDAFVFFKLVHAAYDTVIKNSNKKNLIFYHIHNPDTYALLNFTKFACDAHWIMMVREPIQSCESWITQHYQKYDYSRIAHNITKMLFEIDNLICSEKNCVGIRLEDLKNEPQKTIKALCRWMHISESQSLYEMTAQGKKWWGDPSSPDYLKDGMEPFGKTSINRKVGSIFSDNDQFILRTLFYPFSVRFGYVEENEKKFKNDLAKIRPMMDKLFDFEKKILEKKKMSPKKLQSSGTYMYLRSGLVERWQVLNTFKTYPNMITLLRI